MHVDATSRPTRTDTRTLLCIFTKRAVAERAYDASAVRNQPHTRPGLRNLTRSVIVNGFWNNGTSTVADQTSIAHPSISAIETLFKVMFPRHIVSLKVSESLWHVNGTS